MAEEESALPFDPEAVLELTGRAKRELRKSAKAMRRSVPRAALTARSEALVDKLRELPEILAAKRVALFFPIEAQREIDLRAFDAWLRARGASAFYPVVTGAREDRAMSFADPGSLEALEDRGSGFMEPSPDAEATLELDVVVVPALLVDGRGHRLGYGAGYYDRALARCAPGVFFVAVVYEFGLAAELPTVPTDVPVHAIVTDRRVLRIE